MKKLVNGIIVDMTADEIAVRQSEEQAWNDGAFDMAMEDLRAKRNRLLAESDYIVTMNLEAGTEIPANWSTYRQNLRDLTEGLTTVEQVNTVVFPAKP